jgi:hypothetical protein
MSRRTIPALLAAVLAALAVAVPAASAGAATTAAAVRTAHVAGSTSAPAVESRQLELPFPVCLRWANLILTTSGGNNFLLNQGFRVWLVGCSQSGIMPF